MKTTLEINSSVKERVSVIPMYRKRVASLLLGKISVLVTTNSVHMISLNGCTCDVNGLQGSSQWVIEECAGL